MREAIKKFFKDLGNYFASDTHKKARAESIIGSPMNMGSPLDGFLITMPADTTSEEAERIIQGLGDDKNAQICEW